MLSCYKGPWAERASKPRREGFGLSLELSVQMAGGRRVMPLAWGPGREPLCRA